MLRLTQVEGKIFAKKNHPIICIKPAHFQGVS